MSAALVGQMAAGIARAVEEGSRPRATAMAYAHLAELVTSAPHLAAEAVDVFADALRERPLRVVDAYTQAGDLKSLEHALDVLSGLSLESTDEAMAVAQVLATLSLAAAVTQLRPVLAAGLDVELLT